MAKTVEVLLKKHNIKRSNRKGKKYKITIKGKTIHFGAKGYVIKPSTKKADSYCARSYGIKGKNNPMSANYWSRKLWWCRGKKSMR